MYVTSDSQKKIPSTVVYILLLLMLGIFFRESDVTYICTYTYIPKVFLKVRLEISKNEFEITELSGLLKCYRVLSAPRSPLNE